MKARLILTACGLITAGWAGAAWWILEWAGTRGQPADWSYTERIALTAAHHTLRLLPLALMATQFGILGVCGWWAVRAPRMPIVGDLVPILEDLRAWLKYVWIVVLVGYGCAAWAFFWHRNALIVAAIVGLLPTGGVAYAASMRRAMQVQAVRQGRQQSGWSSRTVALGGIVSAFLGLWPLGLVLFAAVGRAARRDAKPAENAAQQGHEADEVHAVAG